MTNVFTVEEVAAQLKVNPATIRRLIWAGRLPGVRVGRHVRIPADALEKWIAGGGAQRRDGASRVAR